MAGLNQEEGGIYVRGDVGAVIYQPTNARIFQHPSAADLSTVNTGWRITPKAWLGAAEVNKLNYGKGDSSLRNDPGLHLVLCQS